MKGGAGGGGGCGGSSYTSPAKRRWSCLVMGVLGLVILSMLVPLVFLLGLYNGFHSASGYATGHGSSASKVVWVYDPRDVANKNNGSVGEGNKSKHVNDAANKIGPPLQKGNKSKHVNDAANKIGPPLQKDIRIPAEKIENKTAGIPVPRGVPKSFPKTNNVSTSVILEVTTNMRDLDEIEKFCELKFGSYCLWHQEHREKMKDSIVKKMKDLLYVARAYYPSIAKLPSLDKLSQELKQNVQDFERIFSECTTDTDLPLQVGQKIDRMEAVISKAKSNPVDCNNVDKKLRQLVDLTEDEANFHMKQSVFLYELAVQTMPKSLHCLSMRLTVEYFKSPPISLEKSLAEKYSDPELQHYVIFSNNLVASSVVINSTVMHSKGSGNQVFHVLTNRENFFAMKLWFHKNVFKEAAVEVMSIEEDLDLNPEQFMSSDLLLPEEIRLSFRSGDEPSNSQMNTQYISVFSHSYFLLPKLFQSLKKVVVLDHDVVVQRDLSELWNINMNGKVIGSEQLCGVKLSQLKHYLGYKIHGDSCIWMSGVNIIDLVRWKQQNLTGVYHRLVQEKLTLGGKLPEAIRLGANLLTFQRHVYVLEDSWILSGLGHNYRLGMNEINKAAVLHFNGKMKPWLDLGIPKYKGYWRRFLNCENQFLSECNVNP